MCHFRTWMEAVSLRWRREEPELRAIYGNIAHPVVIEDGKSGPRQSGLEKRYVKISADRGRCGLIVGRNFARDGKSPGPGTHGNPSPFRHQGDHIASDCSGPLLSLVQPVLWLFRSAPRRIRLLCCAAFQSRLHLRSRETGRLAIVVGR
jgi:hypothetical protein